MSVAYVCNGVPSSKENEQMIATSSLHGWIAWTTYYSMKGANEKIIWMIYLYEDKKPGELIYCVEGQYNGHIWGV